MKGEGEEEEDEEKWRGVGEQGVYPEIPTRKKSS
jgi:hypothetical protein